MKSFLQNNDIEMNSTHDEGKSVTERFIRTLKNKYITSISKNVCTDKLANIVNKYNNRYQNMKIFLQKVTPQIGLKNVICDHNGEEIARTIYEKELVKNIKKYLKLKK